MSQRLSKQEENDGLDLLRLCLRDMLPVATGESQHHRRMWIDGGTIKFRARSEYDVRVGVEMIKQLAGVFGGDSRDPVRGGTISVGEPRQVTGENDEMFWIASIACW